MNIISAPVGTKLPGELVARFGTPGPHSEGEPVCPFDTGLFPTPCMPSWYRPAQATVLGTDCLSYLTPSPEQAMGQQLNRVNRNLSASWGKRGSWWQPAPGHSRQVRLLGTRPKHSKRARSRAKLLEVMASRGTIVRQTWRGDSVVSFPNLGKSQTGFTHSVCTRQSCLFQKDFGLCSWRESLSPGRKRC